MNAIRMYRAVVLSGLALGAGQGCSAESEQADAPPDGAVDAPLDKTNDSQSPDQASSKDTFSEVRSDGAPAEIAPDARGDFPDEGPDLGPPPDVALDVPVDRFPDEGPPPDVGPADIRFPDEGTPPDAVQRDIRFPDEGGDTLPPDDVSPPDTGDGAASDGPGE